jgi:hypothetical protein
MVQLQYMLDRVLLVQSQLPNMTMTIHLSLTQWSGLNFRLHDTITTRNLVLLPRWWSHTMSFDVNTCVLKWELMYMSHCLSQHHFERLCLRVNRKMLWEGGEKAMAFFKFVWDYFKLKFFLKKRRNRMCMIKIFLKK